MPDNEPRRSLDEIARLGTEAIERYVQPARRPEDEDKFVAIDVDTGDYELDEDDYAAVTRLHARRPLAEIWLGRIGQPQAYKIRRGR